MILYVTLEDSDLKKKNHKLGVFFFPFPLAGIR